MESSPDCSRRKKDPRRAGAIYGTQSVIESRGGGPEFPNSNDEKYGERRALAEQWNANADCARFWNGDNTKFPTFQLPTDFRIMVLASSKAEGHRFSASPSE